MKLIMILLAMLTVLFTATASPQLPCRRLAFQLEDHVASLPKYSPLNTPVPLLDAFILVNYSATISTWAPSLGFVKVEDKDKCVRLVVYYLMFDVASRIGNNRSWEFASESYDLAFRDVRFNFGGTPPTPRVGPDIWNLTFVAQKGQPVDDGELESEPQVSLRTPVVVDHVLETMEMLTTFLSAHNVIRTLNTVTDQISAAAASVNKTLQLVATIPEPRIINAAFRHVQPLLVQLENKLLTMQLNETEAYWVFDPAPPLIEVILTAPIASAVVTSTVDFKSEGDDVGYTRPSSWGRVRDLIVKAAARTKSVWGIISWYLITTHWVTQLLPTGDVGLKTWHHRYIMLSTACFLLYALADIGIALVTLKIFSSVATVAFGYAQFVYMYYWMISGSTVVNTTEWLREAKIVVMWLHTLLTKRALLTHIHDPNKMRGVFNDCPEVKQKPVENHTHPISAADRNSSALFADHLAAMLGLTPYYVQCSKADVRRGRIGSRKWYWSKDLTTDELPYNPPDSSLLVLTDVDQYMDMNEFLALNTHPVLIYTFQPAQVAADRGDYCYTFKDDVVTYLVAGGGKYEHMVWNWSTETVTATYQVLGMPAYSTCYLIDRRQTDADHQYIFLSPVASWYGPSPATQGITNTRLDRVRMAQPNGFNRMFLQKRDGCMVSTGKQGFYTSANLTLKLDNAIQLAMEHGNHPMALGQIKALIPGRDDEANALYAYFTTKTIDRPAVVCPVSAAVKRYQFNPRNYDGDAKPSLTAFMSPIYDGAYAPDKTKANEAECINERIIKVKSPELTATPFIAECMREFCEHFIPQEDRHTMVPVDVADVWENMARPNQRRGLLDGLWQWDYKAVTETFMKAEAYANVKAPRNISTLDPKLKLDYSTITYSLANYLKTKPWYAFSKTPLEIATRVADVCAKADFVVNSDFSKFDGHVSNLLRDVEMMILMRAFHPKYHTLVRECHKSQHHVKGVAKFGTKYETDYTRLSGSPETSLFNSIDNAFVAYLAFRFAKVDSKQAYKRLGIYGGDDGLTADLPISAYKQAASAVGQDLTTERVVRNTIGVKFLARMYSPHVWDGDLNSVCDIKRQAAKFHTTVNLPPGVTAQQKLLEKTRCVLMSDANTPVIGDFATAVARIHGAEIKADAKLSAITPWMHKTYTLRSQQYPNDVGDWVIELLNKEMPDFEYKKFLKHIGDTKDLNDLMKLPLFAPSVLPESKKDVVVNGDLYGPSASLLASDSKKDIKLVEAKNQKKSVRFTEQKTIVGADKAAPSVVKSENKVVMTESEAQAKYVAKGPNDEDYIKMLNLSLEGLSDKDAAKLMGLDDFVDTTKPRKAMVWRPKVNKPKAN